MTKTSSIAIRVFAVGLLSAATTFALVADARLAKTGDSTASFRASGPGGMNIDGTTSELLVADDDTLVTITVPLEKLKTGIALRDKHMREHLGTDQHPNAKLVVERKLLSFPTSAPTAGEVKGKLTLHGKTQDVSFRYNAKLDGEIIRVTGTTQVDMREYDIKVPSYLGIRVKPTVDVKVQFSAKDS